MSSFMADISSLGAADVNVKKSTSRANNTELKMEDFLTLMVVQLQSQTIDDTADTGEMLNQLVQMQMVTALSNMTDASVMSYASSLVGKEITIAIVDKDGNYEEKVLNVTGTGVYGGQQVIFCDDGNMYQLNQILAVGRIPEQKDEEDPENDELSDFEKETKDRLDALTDSIKNNTFDPDSIDSVNDASSANAIGAVKAPESAQEIGNDAAEPANKTFDPFEKGLLDGILVNPNPDPEPAEPVYDGTLGADTYAAE